MKLLDAFKRNIGSLLTISCCIAFVYFTRRSDGVINTDEIRNMVISRQPGYKVNYTLLGLEQGPTENFKGGVKYTVEDSRQSVPTRNEHSGVLQLQKSLTRTYPKAAQVSEARKLLFIHIPKTGGTTIEQSFLFGKKVIGGHRKITEFDPKYFESFHKFCMVRHPCSRLLSAWSYLAQGRGNGKDRRWAKANLTAETKSSFTAFVKKTLAPEGHVLLPEENHLQTQVGMIFREDGTFGLDQILVFERWRDSLDALGKSIATNLDRLKVSHKQRSHHGSCEESYTPETWEKMVKLYAVDFCVLGYSTDLHRRDITPRLDMTPEQLTARYRNCRSLV